MTVLYIDRYEFYRFEDDALYQAIREDENSPSLIGAQFLGRVMHVDPALEGAMIELGTNQPGFLPLRSKQKASSVTEGQCLLVEIKRDAFDGKGPKLELKDFNPVGAAKIPAQVKAASPLWHYAISPLDIQNIPDIFCARRVDEEKIGEWARQREWQGSIHYLPRTQWPDPRDAIADALEPLVSLPSGGRLCFDRTRALSVIDVDSAEFIGQNGMEETAKTVNLEAAREIVRQVSLRNLGGIIVVDFIDLKSAKNRALLAEEIREFSVKDPLIEWAGAMSRLGLLEIKRRRRGKSLTEMFG